MSDGRPTPGPLTTAIAARAAAAALLGVVLSASQAGAYRWYDNGSGSGCVACHNGFQGGTGALHNQHRTLANDNCNLCHPSGGGTTPVLTYVSGPGGGFGCAGCHGLDYGETSPNSLQPKSTAYGLRLHHVNQGEPSCGTGGCHSPGNLGHPDPFPPVLGEDVLPRYYAPAFSILTLPCSSLDEDLPFDLDAIGLDNDGDGLADSADPDCPLETTTTSTTTTTTLPLPFDCGAAPAVGCIVPAKAVLKVDEKKPGKEKLKLSLTKLQATVLPGQFGNPVAGTTAYKICIYDGSNALQGEYAVDRAGDICNGISCWQIVSGKGYKYKDKLATADGITKMTLSGGELGKGKAVIGAKNGVPPTMPIGVAPALQGETSATVQLLSSDGACFGAALPTVKKADGPSFTATTP